MINFMLPSLRKSVHTILPSLNPQCRHISLLRATRVPYYDANRPIGSESEPAQDKDRGSYQRQVENDRTNPARRITKYSDYHFQPASTCNLVLWKRGPPTSKNPEKIGEMTLQEALDYHVYPGLCLVPRKEKLEGQDSMAMPQYDLKSIYSEFEKFEYVSRSKILNIRDLRSRRQVTDRLKKAHSMLKQEERFEIHIRRPAGVGKEEFFKIYRQSYHLRPDVFLKAMPENSQLLIEPQANDEDVCWAVGPLYATSGRLPARADDKMKLQPTFTNVFHSRRHFERRQEESRSQNYPYHSKFWRMPEPKLRVETRRTAEPEPEENAELEEQAQPGKIGLHSATLGSREEPKSARIKPQARKRHEERLAGFKRLKIIEKLQARKRHEERLAGFKRLKIIEKLRKEDVIAPAKPVKRFKRIKRYRGKIPQLKYQI
jgi:hypothetical protein